MTRRTGLLLALGLVACGPRRALESCGSYFDPESGIDEPDGRDDFGYNKLPVWSPLFGLEVDVVAGAEKARTGDAKALLSLALLGERFHDPMLESRLHAFITSVRFEMDAEHDPARRALVLHRAMHREFLGAKPGVPKLSTDDIGRDSLTDIFVDGRFDCLSSAILYLIVARSFGFEAEAAVMSSHVFVQLTLPDGRKIDVETSSPEGFGWIHDETFFAGPGRVWAAQRGLKPGTFADYQARRIIPAYLLLVENMQPGRMVGGGFAKDNADRLHEIAGIIAYDQPDFVVARLAVWHREGLELSRRTDYIALLRLGRLSAPVLADAVTRFPEDARIADLANGQRMLTAEALAGLSQGDEAVRLAALAMVAPGGPDRVVIQDRALSVVGKVAAAHRQAGKFALAEAVYARFAEPCTRRTSCAHDRAVNQLKWGESSYERRAWQDAATHAEAALALAPDEETRAAARRNAATAWVDEATEHIREGHGRKAAAVLDRCLARLPDAAPCRTTRDQLATRGAL